MTSSDWLFNVGRKMSAKNIFKDEFPKVLWKNIMSKIFQQETGKKRGKNSCKIIVGEVLTRRFYL